MPRRHLVSASAVSQRAASGTSNLPGASSASGKSGWKIEEALSKQRQNKGKKGVPFFMLFVCYSLLLLLNVRVFVPFGKI